MMESSGWIWSMTLVCEFVYGIVCENTYWGLRGCNQLQCLIVELGLGMQFWNAFWKVMFYCSCVRQLYGICIGSDFGIWLWNVVDEFTVRLQCGR